VDPGLRRYGTVKRLATRDRQRRSRGSMNVGLRTGRRSATSTKERQLALSCMMANGSVLCAHAAPRARLYQERTRRPFRGHLMQGAPSDEARRAECETRPLNRNPRSQM